MSFPNDISAAVGNATFVFAFIFGHFILYISKVSVYRVGEISYFILPTQCKFHTLVQHLCTILFGNGCDTVYGRCGEIDEDIFGFLVEVIHCTGQTIVE